MGNNIAGVGSWSQAEVEPPPDPRIVELSDAISNLYRLRDEKGREKSVLELRLKNLGDDIAKRQKKKDGIEAGLLTGNGTKSAIHTAAEAIQQEIVRLERERCQVEAAIQKVADAWNAIDAQIAPLQGEREQQERARELQRLESEVRTLTLAAREMDKRWEAAWQALRDAEGRLKNHKSNTQMARWQREHPHERYPVTG